MKPITQEEAKRIFVGRGRLWVFGRNVIEAIANGELALYDPKVHALVELAQKCDCPICELSCKDKPKE
jgi:hypothetical protein